MEVIGSTYPVHPMKMLAAQALGYARNAVIVLAIGGDYGFQWAGMPVPPWYSNSLGKNKFGWAMGAWFIGNMGHNALTATHAFEIYANGDLVFSKLQTGRLPSAAEFFEGVEQAIPQLRNMAMYMQHAQAAGSRQGTMPGMM